MKTYLKQLIQADEMEKTFSLLEKVLPSLPSDLQNQFILFRNNYNSALRDQRSGIVTAQETRAVLTRIKKNLLDTLPDIPDDVKVDVAGGSRTSAGVMDRLARRGRLLAGLLLLSGVAVLVAMNYLPKRGVVIDFEVTSDRIAFVPTEAHDLSFDFVASDLHLQNVEEAKLTVPRLILHPTSGDESLRIDENTGGHFALLPTPFDDGNSLRFEGRVGLTKLAFPRNSIVILENADVPAESEGNVAIRLENGRIQGTLSIQDSVAFEVNSMQLEQAETNLSREVFFEEGTLYPGGQTGTLSFMGKPAFAIHISSSEDKTWLYEFTNVDIAMDSVEFQKPDIENGRTVSSIIEVKGSILTEKGQAVKKVTIDEGKYLFLKNTTSLSLKDLRIGEKRIQARLVGRVGEVYERLGTNVESEAYFLNPSLLAWYWCSNKILLLVGAAVFLAVVGWLLWLSGRRLRV